MKRSNIERRTLTGSIETRMDTLESGKTFVRGYAAMYDKETKMGAWNEVIRSGFFTPDLIARSDIRALFNHDPNHLLARSKRGNGTLRLNADSFGLEFEFLPPQHRSDIYEMLERGDLDQCSFAFRLSDMGQNWTRNDEDVDLRELVICEELYDITLATYPAYEDTTVAAEARSAHNAVRADSKDYLAQYRANAIKIINI